MCFLRDVDVNRLGAGVGSSLVGIGADGVVAVDTGGVELAE